MGQSSVDYAYGEGAGDVERTLKMVATRVVGGQTAMAEVSLKSISEVVLCIIETLLDSQIKQGNTWNESKW